MTPSTTTSSAAAPGRVNEVWIDVYAVVCALSAGVHAALVGPHAAESTLLAVAFAAAAAFLAAAAVAQAISPSPRTALAGAALLVAVAAAYLLSRSVGLPGLIDHPEPLDPLGSVITCLEVAAAVGLLRHLPRRHT